MRTALLIGALILGCSSGSDRRGAEAPEAPSEAEESDGFTPEQRAALDELLHDGNAGAPSTPSSP